MDVMQPPKMPADESARLAALESYRVLDTGPEPALDALVAVASRLMDTPIALVSLVDEHRQWFKARHGLDAPEAPRDVSFCGHVVADGKELVVPDALADERFADNPLVLGDPRVRFYAGVPLRTMDGHVLGTLCAIDHEPRQLSEAALDLLRGLAEHATAQLELRRSQRLLVEERERLDALLDGLHDGVVVQEPGGAIVRNNLIAEKILGLTGAQMRGRSSVDPRWQSVRPDGTPFPGEEHPAMVSLASGKPIRGVTMGVRKPDDSLTWISVNAEPLFHDDSPTPSAVITTFRDQTEEWEARLALVAERALLQRMLEAIPGTAVFLYGPALRVQRVFGAAVRQLVPFDIEGREVVSWLPEELQEEAARLARETLSGASGRLDVSLGDRRVELRFVSLGEDDDGGLAVAYDVSERDRMRERLARQERLVTTGTLAAGVGHEVNNPLSYVIGNLDFGLEELRAIAGASSSSRFNELIEVLVDAREGAERIRTIVKGLRAFAREGSGVEPIDLRGAVEISSNMSMHELRSKCSFENRLGTLPRVVADESKLSQVFVNLLVNAAQAFESNDPVGNRVVVEGHQEGAFVRVSVRDNGPGVPEEVLPHIFDPFFTTKPTGVGTGLGLAISHSIVTDLGGRIECTSSAGGGTTFHVLLPAAEGDGIVDADSPACTPGMGRVLLVDDDESVLRTVGRLLRRQHDVVSVSDPREALRRLQAGEPFDAVVCDIVMPHLTGDQLFVRMMETRPELEERFTFMSGGLRSSGRESRVDGLGRPVLEKPFDVKVLRDMVKALVDGEPVPS